MDVSDALGRITDPVARWRERQRARRLLRFLLSGSQTVYQYPRFRWLTDRVVDGTRCITEWIRLGANCAMV